MKEGKKRMKEDGEGNWERDEGERDQDRKEEEGEQREGVPLIQEVQRHKSCPVHHKLDPIDWMDITQNYLKAPTINTHTQSELNHVATYIIQLNLSLYKQDTFICLKCHICIFNNL